MPEAYPTRVRAIIAHDGKFLLVRNRSSRGDFWCLPGGKVEPGESLIQGLSREILEETGIQAEIGNLVYVHQFGEPGSYGAPEFFFAVTNGSDFLHIDLSQTTHGEAELAAIGFVDITALSNADVRPDFLIQELPARAAEHFNGPTRYKLTA